ncbi:MAG: hypothetical protein R2853_14670 [Thermomicrobiales bacterium]
MADLVAETNACILEAFRDDGGFWAYLPCIELAQVVDDLRPPRESNYPVPDGIDAAMTTTYAAADLLSAVGSSDTSDWQQDVDTLLEMSDKYLAQYEALPDLDEDDVPASEPDYDSMMAQAALATTADCLNSAVFIAQFLWGDSAAYSAVRCSRTPHSYGYVAERARPDRQPASITG